MFKIGEFSRLSRVSVRMLRHYDQLGLLTPSQIDSLTNYRYYSADQLPRLNRILAFRDLGFSLEQVHRLEQASPIDLGFPHSFLGSEHVHGLIVGKTFEQIILK